MFPLYTWRKKIIHVLNIGWVRKEKWRGMWARKGTTAWDVFLKYVAHVTLLDLHIESAEASWLTKPGGFVVFESVTNMWSPSR